MEKLYSLDFLKKAKKIDITPDRELPNYLTNGVWMIHKSLFSEQEILDFGELLKMTENDEKAILSQTAELEEAVIEDCIRPLRFMPVMKVISKNYSQFFYAHYIKLIHDKISNYISIVDVYHAKVSSNYVYLVFKQDDLVLAVVAPLRE